MGLPCLRYDGRFFASLDRGTHALVVKLPQPRVQVLLAEAKALAAGGASSPQPAPPTAVFAGFGEDGLAFLAGLERDNTKAC